MHVVYRMWSNCWRSESSHGSHTDSCISCQPYPLMNTWLYLWHRFASLRTLAMADISRNGTRESRWMRYSHFYYLQTSWSCRNRKQKTNTRRHGMSVLGSEFHLHSFFFFFLLENVLWSLHHVYFRLWVERVPSKTCWENSTAGTKTCKLCSLSWWVVGSSSASEMNPLEEVGGTSICTPPTPNNIWLPAGQYI